MHVAVTKLRYPVPEAAMPEPGAVAVKTGLRLAAIRLPGTST